MYTTITNKNIVQLVGNKYCICCTIIPAVIKLEVCPMFIIIQFIIFSWTFLQQMNDLFVHL